MLPLAGWLKKKIHPKISKGSRKIEVLDRYEPSVLFLFKTGLSTHHSFKPNDKNSVA